MLRRSLALTLAVVGLWGLVLAGCGGRPQATEALTAAPVDAPQVQAIQVDGAWASYTARPGEQRPVNGVTSAIYLRLVNSGDEMDALVALKTEVARSAELHRTTLEGDVVRMQFIERLEIPPGGVAELKRGSNHVMLMGLTRNLVPGERFQAVLVLEKAGEVSVEVEVREE